MIGSYYNACVHWLTGLTQADALVLNVTHVGLFSFRLFPHYSMELCCFTQHLNKSFIQSNVQFRSIGLNHSRLLQSLWSTWLKAPTNQLSFCFFFTHNKDERDCLFFFFFFFPVCFIFSMSLCCELLKPTIFLSGQLFNSVKVSVHSAGRQKLRNVLEKKRKCVYRALRLDLGLTKTKSLLGNAGDHGLSCLLQIWPIT